jgi:hypothetical protein
MDCRVKPGNDGLVPRTRRSAQHLRSGAPLSRGRYEGSIRDGPGSAEQREERCTAPGTREPRLPVLAVDRLDVLADLLIFLLVALHGGFVLAP